MASESRQKMFGWPYPRYSAYQRALQEAAAAWFAEKGFAVDRKYSYILDQREHWPKNIILPEVAEFIEKVRTERQEAFQPHKFIHHGLSSQAMLFNLVGPLMLAGDYTPLLVAMKQQCITWPQGKVTAELEHEDRNVFGEDSGQPTSIDLLLRGDIPGPALFIEGKLSEAKFGGCSVFAQAVCDGHNPAQCLDSCYLHFIGRKYWDLLEKYGFLNTAIGTDSMCILANHYQFFRELLFALERGGTFVLLYDERSPAFFCRHREDPTQTRGLMAHLLALVPENLRPRVGHVSIQQVVTAIKTVGGHEHWIGEFERKYGLIQKNNDTDH